MSKHKKHAVRAHERAAPTRKPKPAPAPGQTSFSPEEEQSMRAGQRQANMAPPPMGGDEDMGGMM
jgi:hypothetical protein